MANKGLLKGFTMGGKDYILLKTRLMKNNHTRSTLVESPKSSNIFPLPSLLHITFVTNESSASFSKKR